MKRFSHGVVPGHSVARGPQPQDDGPFCLYDDHLTEVAAAVRAFAKWRDLSAAGASLRQSVTDGGLDSAMQIVGTQTQDAAERWLEEHHETT